MYAPFSSEISQKVIFAFPFWRNHLTHPLPPPGWLRFIRHACNLYSQGWASCQLVSMNACAVNVTTRASESTTNEVALGCFMREAKIRILIKVDEKQCSSCHILNAERTQSNVSQSGFIHFKNEKQLRKEDTPIQFL